MNFVAVGLFLWCDYKFCGGGIKNLRKGGRGRLPPRYEFWGISSKYHFGELKFINDSRSHEMDESDN